MGVEAINLDVYVSKAVDALSADILGCEFNMLTRGRSSHKS